MPISKYLQQHLTRMKWPQLLILKDKHSTSHYLCKDQEALGLACLSILKQRLDPRYGYLQHPGPESEIYGLKEELTKEAAGALPEPYRKQALGVIAANAKLRREWAEAVAQYENAKQAVKQKDGMLAYQILFDRRDYEYEGFDIEAPIIPGEEDEDEAEEDEAEAV